MRLLKSIYFFNSGSMPFAKVNLDGNIHIIGKNGSGKTSILRAILFFYNPETQALGIGNNQKNFVDFYFPEINSFIVYEVEKETFTYLVIAFKKQNRIFFRIVETEYKQEYFIIDNRVKTFPEIMEGLNKDKKYYLNKNIETYSSFKSMIYSVDNEFKRYSIFESRGTNYQNIPRTIANIFLNFTLDSKFIKRSIMNSFMEEPLNIDLAKMKHQLGDFDKSFNDIKAFEHHTSYAKNIVKIYSRLSELEAQKKELARMLGYKANNSRIEKVNLESAIKVSGFKLKELNDQIESVGIQFNQAEREFDNNIHIQKTNIEIAETKKLYYQKINIDKIVEAVVNESSLEQELKILDSELNLLLSEHLDIKKKFELMRGEINLSLKEKDNEFNEQKNELKQQLVKEKEEIKKEFDVLNQKLTQNYQVYFDEISKKRQTNSDEITNLLIRQSKVEVSVPKSDKLNELSEKVENYNQQIRDRKSNLQKLDGQLKLSNQELKNKTDEKNTKLGYFQEKQTNEIVRLEQELKEIEDKLKVVEQSFSGFLQKEYPGYQDNIARVISEEVLFNTELEPEIIEPNNLLFGIKLNLSCLPVAKTPKDYSEQKELLNTHISRLKNDFENNYRQLKTNFEEQENSINKRINELEKAQARLKSELDKYQVLLEGDSVKLKVIQAESDQLKKQQLEKISEEILSHKSILNNLNQEENKLIIELEKELSLLEMQKETKFQVLESKTLQNIEQLMNRLNEFKLLTEEKLLEIDNAFQKDLQEKGANEPRIKELESKKQSINTQLDFIKKNRQLYHDYLKDKRELLDKVSEFQDNMLRVEREKEVKAKDFQKLKAELTEKVDALKLEYNGLRDSFKDLENEMVIYENFKQSTFFEEIANYIAEENFFLSNDKKISSLINDLHSVNNELNAKSSNLREKITTFTSYFDEKNIFSFKITNHIDQDFRNFAQNLKSFIEDDKLRESQNLLSTNYSLLISTLSNQIEKLTSKEGEIQKTIRWINLSFEKTRLIDVIKVIELRLKESNNQVINYLRKIREFSEQNPSTGEFNLFNQNPNKGNEEKAVELLKKLIKAIEESKLEKISLEESFEIEFRIKENNNDSGFRERLTSVGSNGTDVLVKALIYITLLDVAKSRLKNPNFKIHCIVDEVGILDNNYLKYLIQFANEKGILLLNCSPNTVEASLYEHIYRVRKDQKSNSIVRPLIETRINEIITEPSPNIIAVN